MKPIYSTTNVTPEKQKLLDEFTKLSKENPDDFEVDSGILVELQKLCDLFEKYNSFEKLKKNCAGVPLAILKNLAYQSDYKMRDTRFSQLEPYLLLKGDPLFYKKICPILMERIPFIEQKISKNPKLLEKLKNAYYDLHEKGDIKARDGEFVNSIRPSNRS
jgi:hypothetical protein